MRFLTSKGCSRTSKPATEAVPAEGGRKQVRMRIVVVFPAPLGPRNPTIWPLATENEIRSTATARAYLFVTSLTMIIADKGTFFDSGDQCGLDNSTTALQKPKQHPKKETLSMSISRTVQSPLTGSNLVSAAEFESTFLFPHP